ncbi:unnamed protein product, partial [Meganyctiphanes norvegica]
GNDVTGTKESASTSSITSSSPKKDINSKGIPVGIAAYAAAAAAAAARAKGSSDKKTTEVEKVDKPKSVELEKVDKPKSALSLVSYSRSPSISPDATDEDDDDSKNSSITKSVAKITSPTKGKETKESTSILNPKLEDPKKATVVSSSNVGKNRTLITSGVSSTKVEASKSLIKPGLKLINRSNMSIPKVEVSPAKQNVPIAVAKSGVTANKISEASHTTNVNTQSLDSGKVIDVKVKAPESVKNTNVNTQSLDSGKVTDVKGKAPEIVKTTNVNTQPLDSGKVIDVKANASESVKTTNVNTQSLDSGKVIDVKEKAPESVKNTIVKTQTLDSGKVIDVKAKAPEIVKTTNVNTQSLDSGKVIDVKAKAPEIVKTTNVNTQSLDSGKVIDVKAKAPESVKTTNVNTQSLDSGKVIDVKEKAPESVKKTNVNTQLLDSGKVIDVKAKAPESVKTTNVNTQSLDSGKVIDVKAKAPESVKKESSTSRIIKLGNFSTLKKTEPSSNIIKHATGQETNVSIKQKIVVESDKTPKKHMSQPNVPKTESQIKVPITYSPSVNKSEQKLTSDNTQQGISLSKEGNKSDVNLAEKSNVNVSFGNKSVSKLVDENKTELHSSKSEITVATPIKEKSPEVKEKTFTPVVSEKIPDLDISEKNQQMIKSTISPHTTKSFPKAGSSSAMIVDPNIGKKEAIKRPCPEASEENDKPSEKREKKEEVVNREKDVEVKEGNESYSKEVKAENENKSVEGEKIIEKHTGVDLKEAKEDTLSNEDKDQALTNGSSGPASELADEESNDIEMKEDSNDAEMKDEESMDDSDVENVRVKKKRRIIEDDDDDDEEGDADEKKDDDDDEDDDDYQEDESGTPSRRTSKRKTKKYYERPRGYGGKFLKDKKPEISALIDENARMDMDEDSQSSISKKRVPRYRCEIVNPESTEAFTAEKVVEYVWPLEGNGEHYFLQEQISQYLGIMSFKRKYPDLRRRPIEMQERDYLKEKGYVSEIACDLGLTAVRSEDVLDVMCNDFPSKFESLSSLMREKQEKEIREKGKVDYTLANIDKSKMQEYARKAAEQAARWNSNLNKERREERRYSFDLSSFTLHISKGRGKILPAEYTKIGSYPVSVLPGQYTDSYRMYSPAALHTLPLSTVTSDPLKEELGSDGEDVASEEEEKPVPIFSEMPWIYSKQANTPNKENVTENGSGGRRADFEINFKIQVAEYALQHTNAQAERKFQTSEANVRRWKQQLDSLRAKAAANGFTKAADKPEDGPKCKHCSGNRQENKMGRPEPMLTCATCKCHTHLTCVDLTTVMIPKLESYKWQCIDCKTCMQCKDPDDAEKMIFCDMCDRGYHIYCVGLKKVPNGRWHCKECAICSSCKSRTPQGDEHIKNAEWQHEFKKDAAKQLRYAATLCIPCDRFWKKRQFCYICTRVYKSIPDDGMVRCANCPKYIHKDGCATMFENEIFCNICYKSRNSSALNHSRIIAAAKKKMARSY